jgi:hypothetical protein
LKFFSIFRFLTVMMDNDQAINWHVLASPYGKAERALGQLSFALEASVLHPTWLWREIIRSSAAIAQAGGYQVKVGQLRLALIGAAVEGGHDTPGLAAAKRIFLASAPLFRAGAQTDSHGALWPAFWHREDHGEPLRPGAASSVDDHDLKRKGEGGLACDQLRGLVRELSSSADDGRRPALINLLVTLRRHAATRRMPAHLVRIALPLALFEARLVSKASPGLLGGRRLALGMSRAMSSDKPLTDWLAFGLGDLAREADQSYRRLVELTRQHQAWRAALARAGLRRNALAPGVLDLLAATPVLSIGLTARHLDCSHVAAGKIIKRLVDLGVLIEQTSRSRHKIFIAGDLSTTPWDEADIHEPLSWTEPVEPVDVDGIAATLDSLVADLERAMVKMRAAHPSL